MTALPPLLRERVRGDVVAAVVPQTVTGLSAIGGKLLVFTNLPAVYLHDGGGVVANTTTKQLESTALQVGWSCFPQWCQPRDTLQCLLKFERSVSARVRLQSDLAWAVVKQVLEPALPSSVSLPYGTPFPVELLAEFSQGREAARSRSSVQSHPGLQELLMTGRTGAQIYLEGGRIRLRRYDEPVLLDAPADVLLPQVDDHWLVLAGQTVLQGEPVKQVALHLPSPALAQTLAETIRSQAGDGTTHAALDTANITATALTTGVLNGYVVRDEPLDLVVRSDRIEIRGPGTQEVLQSFFLNEESTGIEGTAACFVVGDKSGSLVLLRTESPPVHELIAAHAEIVATARRSAKKGPYVGVLDDGMPLRLEVGNGHIELARPDGFASVAVESLADMQPSVSEEECSLTLRTQDEQLRVRAEQPMLEGIWTAAQRERVALQARGRPQMLAAAIIEMEADWFLYSAFGVLAELHLSLGSRWGLDDDRRLIVPEEDDDKESLLLELAQVVLPLREHNDAVVQSLAQFVVAQDSAWFQRADEEEPKNLDSSRDTYYRAFAPLQVVQGQLTRLERELARVDSARKAFANSSLRSGRVGASFGLAVGAAALGNPLLLLAAPVRFISKRKQAEEGSKNTREEAASVCVGIWNYLLFRLLPPVAFRMLEALHPARQRVSRTMLRRVERTNSRQHLRIMAAMADRFARLECFRSFPSDRTTARPRGEAIDMLWDLQKEYGELPFAGF